MNEQHSLISRQFFRAPKSGPFVRHDLRLWESAVNRDARLRDDAGTVLLGDAVMADWKARTTAGDGAGARLLRRASRSHRAS